MQIHLIKSVQATPFVRVLEKAGTPVRKLSERAGMPIDAVYTGKGVIGEYALWRFIDLAAIHEQLDLFGYDVASQYPMHSVEGFGGVRTRTATTLKELLEYFIEDVQTESTGCPYSLLPDTDGLWFIRELMFGENRKNWQTEQYMIAIIIQIVRLVAGPKWLPPEVSANSSDNELPIPVEWKNINFTWGGKATKIKIPEQVLALPLSKELVRKKSAPDDEPGAASIAPLNFTELVRTQILTNNLGLENAAKQTGLSPKTLKRRLSSLNTSYSELVDQARFLLAKSMLKNTGMSISSIAEELRYQHQSNFTRSFKRVCGITPQEYRTC